MHKIEKKSNYNAAFVSTSCVTFDYVDVYSDGPSFLRVNGENVSFRLCIK